MGFETVADQKPPNLRGRAASKWYQEHGQQPPSKQDKQPRRTGTRKPRLSHNKVTVQLMGGMSLLQGIIFMGMPQEIAEQYAPDALTPQEMALLADALADEVLANAWLSKMFAQLDKVGPHGKLAMVLASIALPRLIRHGVLPRELEPAISGFASAAVSMGAGTAHDADRGYGIGEIDPSVNPADAEKFYADIPIESRFGQVPNGHHQPDDQTDDESEVPPNRTPAAAEAD